MDRQLNAIWQINIICCAGIAITNVYELYSITSLLFYISFIITALSMYLCMRKPVTGYTQNTLIVLFFLVIFGVVSILPGSLNFGYIKKFLIYVTTLFSYYISFKLRPADRTVKYLLYSNVLVSITYIIRSQARGAYQNKLLYLFFSNPNLTGMWLCMSMMLLAITVFFVHRKMIKLALLAMAAQLGYLCMQTEARNIWLALVLACVLGALCISSRTVKYKKFFIFLVDLFPLLFAWIYMLILKYGVLVAQLTSLLVSKGKPLTSRFAIWTEAFEHIKKYPIFGAYSVVGNGSGSFQLHNTHIDVWAAYGTVGLVLFLVYVYRIMREANARSASKGSMIALTGFMCMTLMGNAEASLYSTGMGMYIYVSSFLILANYFNQRK